MGGLPYLVCGMENVNMNSRYKLNIWYKDSNLLLTQKIDYIS